MNITTATKENAASLAELHRSHIPTGFLSKQSFSFLTSLYVFLIENEIVYCAENEGKIIGFVAATTTTSGLYKKFFKKNIIILLVFVLRNIYKIVFIKKAIETFLAPRKSTIHFAIDELPELLSIVVSRDCNGMGIGKYLVAALEEKFTQLGKNEYKVIVGSTLEANGFYQKIGFKKQKEFELHKNSTSFLYLKLININRDK